MGDLANMSDDELNARIMAVLKKKCDQGGFPYPEKLVRYMREHSGIIPRKEST